MSQVNSALTDVSADVHEHRGWFIAAGAALMLIGVAAIIFPHIATVSTNFFVGWLLVIGGLVHVIHAFSAKDWPGFFWSLTIGVVQALAGLFLLIYPVAGVLALTIYVAAVFFAEGIMRAVLAFKIRPQQGWVWALVAGIVSILVGLLIWAKLPSSAVWSIGLLAGLNLLMSGWMLVMMAMASDGQESETTTAP